MEEAPTPKRPRDGDEEEQRCAAGDVKEDNIVIVAKKSVAGSTSELEVDLPRNAVIGDLAARLAGREECEKGQITLVYRGKVLSQPTVALTTLVGEAEGARIVVVYLVRKPASAKAVNAPAASSASTAPPAAAPVSASSAPPAKAAPAAAPAGDAPVSALGAPLAKAAPAAVPAGSAASAAAALSGRVLRPASHTDITAGLRVLLLLRHGQCCHDHEGDELKGLTMHGHSQAEESARYVAGLFAAGKIPEQRALLHSTSRRARETAAKLPDHLPGLEVWNADLLRETDPANNPLRAEEVFNRIFAAPVVGEGDTLIVVAHNNIILYLLMRAAGVPIERAAQAWRLFHLRHASVTRIDISGSGAKQVVSIGGAGHIPHPLVTWNNITGADMAAWKGGEAERHKFGGRMVLLVRQVLTESEATAEGAAEGANLQQREAVAAHVKGLGEYMVSRHLHVACSDSPAARSTAAAVATLFRRTPQVLRLRDGGADVADQLEAAFLQFFSPPGGHNRDTVVLVAEDRPLLYWLLRALGLSSEESQESISSYNIGHGSVTLVNIRSNGTMKVVSVGDTGHLPLDYTFP